MYTIQEKALLIKRFYENQLSCIGAVRRLEYLRSNTMPSTVICKIMKFETNQETGNILRRPKM